MRRIKNSLRTAISRTLHRLGYVPSMLPPSLVDLREVCNHPGSLHYYGNFNPVLMDVDIHRGRGLRVFPMNDIHPYIYAIRTALEAANRDAAARKILDHYYATVQPSSAAEWVNLSSIHKSTLHGMPPWAISMPWDVRSPDAWQYAREQFAINEGTALNQNLTISDGWHFWGPVSEGKLLLESQRLSRLIRSFETRGHYRHNGHDGDVRAIILRHGNDWCWQVAGGEHRAAMLAALGHTSIPVRVIQIIQREDVDYWPGVINNTYTKQAALETFDLIFSGALPEVAKSWRKDLL